MRRQLLRLLTATWLGCLATTGFAQQATIASESKAFKSDSDPVYLTWQATGTGIETCVRCHLGGEIQTPFCDLKEMERWVTKDKHTIARRRVEPFSDARTEEELIKLIRKIDASGNRDDEFIKEVSEQWVGTSNLLSQRICEKLWPKSPMDTPQGYAKFRDNCLTCHGGYQSDESESATASKQVTSIGINCLYCHEASQSEYEQAVATTEAPAGPDASRIDWRAFHQLETWRGLRPNAKTAKGMRDLVNVANQAELCLDCHVGNRQKNMFVTHNMYAAGHPPLPSVELQTFSAAMPQHWQTPSELAQSLANDTTGMSDDYADYFEHNYGKVLQDSSPEETYWDTRKLLMGSLMARKKNLDLVIDSIEQNDWGDYSLYDCASCHHELRSTSVRQRRGYPAAPGRPRQHEWPSAVLSLAHEFGGQEIADAASKTELKLATTFGVKPFGEPSEVKTVAEQLRRQIEQTVKIIEARPIKAQTALNVLQRLTQTPEDELVTYDSARQVVWAMQTVTEELKSKGFPIGAGVHGAVMKLGEHGTSGINSQLPSGRTQFIYDESLEEDLKLRSQYDPAKLKTQLIQIGKSLGVTQAARIRIGP